MASVYLLMPQRRAALQLRRWARSSTWRSNEEAGALLGRAEQAAAT
jgi:hypothetical protein